MAQASPLGSHLLGSRRNLLRCCAQRSPGNLLARGDAHGSWGLHRGTRLLWSCSQSRSALPPARSGVLRETGYAGFGRRQAPQGCGPVSRPAQPVRRHFRRRGRLVRGGESGVDRRTEWTRRMRNRVGVLRCFVCVVSSQPAAERPDAPAGLRPCRRYPAQPSRSCSNRHFVPAMLAAISASVIRFAAEGDGSSSSRTRIGR